MSHSQALNIIELSDGADMEDILDKMGDLVFPLKQFFLQNVPIRVVWKKRTRQLQKWEEVERVLIIDLSNKVEFEEPVFDLLQYEGYRSTLLLKMSAAVLPSVVLYFAEALNAWEEAYGRWVLNQALKSDLLLLAEVPKASEKRNSAELIKAYKQFGDEWVKSEPFIHEYSRLSKLAQITGGSRRLNQD